MQTNLTCTLLVTSTNVNRTGGRASPTAFQKQLRDKRFQQNNRMARASPPASPSSPLSSSPGRAHPGDCCPPAARLPIAPRPHKPASGTSPTATAPSSARQQGAGLSGAGRGAEGGQPSRKPRGRLPSAAANRPAPRPGTRTTANPRPPPTPQRALPGGARRLRASGPAKGL